jgi:CRP-like cAMP-binding protein
MVAAKSPQTAAPNPTAPLLRKLEALGPLSSAEKDAIAGLPMTLRRYAEKGVVVRQGDAPDAVYLLVDGCVFRFAVVATGKRQIMALHVPGALLNLQNLFLKELDHNIEALIPTTIAIIPKEAIRGLLKGQPQNAMRLWHQTFIDAAIFRKWLVGVGRRSAYARIAHLTCEFFARMTAAGLSRGMTCDFPLTQGELGDALGLSTVHINRTIKQLDRDGLLLVRANLLTIYDWPRLQVVADFDPAYLELVEPTVARQ